MMLLDATTHAPQSSKRVVELDHDTLTTLIRNYRAVYDYLYGLSWKEEDILEELLSLYDNRNTNRELSLRKQYPEEDLEYYFDGWHSYSNNRKRDVLGSIGINTIQFEFYTMKGLYRNRDNILCYGNIVYGQERTDSAWANKRVEGYSVASTDAIVRNSIYKWGYDFRKDMAAIGEEE